MVGWIDMQCVYVGHTPTKTKTNRQPGVLCKIYMPDETLLDYHIANIFQIIEYQYCRYSNKSDNNLIHVIMI